MSDEENTGSGWTTPPKGKAKKPKTTKANARRRGNKHTVQRRITAEKVNGELADGLHPHDAPREDIPLMNAFDLVPPGEMIPELTPDEKRGAGGTYREEFARIARTICELGGTDIEVATALGVSLSTMWGWQARYEDFFRAMIVGKDLPDERVIRALYQRAVGYTYPEFDLRVINHQLVVTPTLKHIPPDVGACNAWLRSRRKSEWNPAVNMELTGTDAFRNMWAMVAQGQLAPMIEGTAVEVEDGQ